jgi:hypothetical protein
MMKNRRSIERFSRCALPIVLIMVALSSALPKADGGLQISSRLEIVTFWSDFVSIKWYVKVNLSDPIIRLIMIIPEDVVNGNLSSAGVFTIPKEIDPSTNSTTFSIDGPMPLGTVSEDFPNDKYEANYFIGCNFLSQNSMIALGGNIPGPTDNYQASWSLDNDAAFTSRLSEIPAFALNDIGNMTCWLKLSLSIFHRPPFAAFVGVLVNQVPLWLNISGCILATAVFSSIFYELARSRSRKSKRVSMIDSVVVPISAAVIVFVPVYLLALHPFETPLMVLNVESNLVNVLYLYLAILVVGIVIRIVVSPYEAISGKPTLPQQSETRNTVAESEPQAEKSNPRIGIKKQLQTQRLISELSTRENSTLVISTIAASVSLAILAVALQAVNESWFGSAFVTGFAFSLLSFVYRETTIFLVDSTDCRNLNEIVPPLVSSDKSRETARGRAVFFRMVSVRFLLLMPIAAWLEILLPQAIQGIAWATAFVALSIVSTALSLLERRERKSCSS